MPHATTTSNHSTTLRRIVATACTAAALGSALIAGVTTASAQPAPQHSRGYAIGPFTHQRCNNAAAHNAAYFHSHGGRQWNYRCWPTRSGWYYTSPYAA